MRSRTSAKQAAATSADTLPKNQHNPLKRKPNQSAHLSKDNILLGSYYAATSLSVQMMTIMSVACWTGLKLDQWLHSIFPVFASLFTVGAMVLSIYIFVNKVTKR